MPTRLGIELSSAACRIVEIDGSLDFNRDHSETRLTGFAMLPPGGTELGARLSSLRGRKATVVVWAPGANHRSVVVADGVYERMRSNARSAVEAAGRSTSNALCDIAPVADFSPDDAATPGRRGRRVVVLASAPAGEVASMLRPLIRAGIRVDRVLTPAAALVSLAHTRRSFLRTGEPETYEVYVALDETAGSVAVIREGTLIAATGLPWGFVEEHYGQRVLRGRDEIAARLAGDLAIFLADGGLDHASLQHVCLASGFPELRSAAMKLMERLDVEVEPLDSLFAINGAELPECAGDCREYVPALRLAWAAAAHDKPLIDLLRHRRWQALHARMAFAAVISGLAAGLALGVAIQDQWRPARAPRALAVLKASAIPLELVTLPPSHPDTPLPRPSPLRIPTIFRVPAPPPSRNQVADSSPAHTTPVAQPPVVAPAPTPRPPAVSRPEPLPAAQPPDDDSPLPFDAVLETVLVGPDRRLALIDGRIVAPGDIVRGARVVEITASEVLLRDERGRLRRLTPAGQAR